MKNDYSKKWLSFTGISFLSFACYLDFTVVNVALPTIQHELQANLVELQWIMNIYFLALCVLATIMGRLGDLYGRRFVFYVGAIVFGIASLVAGFSMNIQWLIFGRFLQGVGAAIVLPLGPSLLPESFPPHEHAKSIARLGSLGGIALALGPVVAGPIVTHWGWRWIFLINIPIIILGFLFCSKSIAESKIEHVTRDLDVAGSFLTAISVGGLVLGLLHGQSVGWINILTIFYFVVCLLGSIALFKIETKKENPLIDFNDFSNPLFYSGAFLCFITGVLSAVALFFDPLYLQNIRHQSPELSGIVLFAIPIAVFIFAFFVGWVVNTIGIIYSIIVGLILAMLSSFLQIFFTIDTPLWYVIFAFLILGSMWALGNTVPIIAAQTAVGPKRASVATGTVVTMFNIGGSIGLAISIVVHAAYGFKGVMGFLFIFALIVLFSVLLKVLLKKNLL